MIDEKGANSWRLASDYIPFYRALEPNYEVGKVANHPFGDLKSLGAFKPYKGKTDKINVPLVESILKNTAAAIDLGHEERSSTAYCQRYAEATACQASRMAPEATTSSPSR